MKKRKKWMQSVHPHKGQLHRNLGIPQGEGIPTSTLRQHEHDSGVVGREARLALRYRGMADGGEVESAAQERREPAGEDMNEGLSPATVARFQAACRGR